ncbi:hypothetical protein CQW23_32647 [Capsicum baccatum]|uniref:MBD domain-containing protein n=1 Tax=Capsicum baccatum TaxID=33114 RepID=A0A2G2V431_CAPBA|nr:hypothetical protein CQW23_32647 [Capsicum baccatum]
MKDKKESGSKKRGSNSPTSKSLAKRRKIIEAICRDELPKYYCEPVSGKKFRSMPEVLRFLKTGSKRKKSTGGNATILGHLLFMETWFLKAKDKNGMLSSRLCLKGMQIGMQHRDLIVVDGFLLWRRNSQKVLHLNSVHDVQVILSQVRAMEAVTIVCIGVGC